MCLTFLPPFLPPQGTGKDEEDVESSCLSLAETEDGFHPLKEPAAH